MFTGIVTELGRVRAARSGRIEIEAGAVLTDLEIGGSIAVNGCCLTAVEMGDGWFVAEAVAETLSRTNLGDLAPGAKVNLERPMRLDGRLDGHLVQGHVDAAGTVVAPAPDLRIAAPSELLAYVVEKGSVTVDGVSLTVVSVDSHGFTVAVIPHTAEHTTLGLRTAGDRVNLEADLIAKYVQRLLARTGRL